LAILRLRVEPSREKENKKYSSCMRMHAVRGKKSKKNSVCHRLFWF
jgi:hypothetical protein